MYKIISVLFFFIFPLMGAAQSPATLIPIDPSVRIGKLSNGLTYYLKQNSQPEQRANFYLVQRVGSLQENDDQQGLAHFLEHMCFNGTKHFPKDAIIRYFETLGVKFGEHLNASTSMDRTIYHISDVPAMRQSTLDSCLLILKDWASDLTLDPTEIDKERGVIYEEWRTRTSPSSRLTERNLSKLYPGSKYGTRMPIGKMEIISSFKPTTLYDFYKTWYRPDNQAVIIVGDIDVDHMELQIKEYFGSLTTTGQPLVKAEPVPDNNEAIIIADQDKEQATDFVQVFFKCAPITPTMKATEAYLTYQVTKDMAMNMLRQRILERAQSPDCPFLNGAVGYGAYLFANTKYAFQLSILPKKNETARSVAVLLEESLRAMRHGFTPTEFVRARAHSKMYLDRRYANRHQQTNALLGNAYTEHFLTNEPIPSIEDHYRLRSRVINTLTLEDINRFAARLIASKDTNVVMLHYSKAEDSTPQPAPQMLKSILDSVWHQPLTPYEDKVTNTP